MREIKFRGKRLVNDEWVYGFLIQYENGWFICNFIGDAYQYKVDPSTVGQYTGLKDKNGKEIYEGDICFVEIYDNFGTISKDECFYAKVVWMNNGFHLVDVNGKIWTEWMTDYNDSLEVVGNIYDNPELLKEVE